MWSATSRPCPRHLGCAMHGFSIFTRLRRGSCGGARADRLQRPRCDRGRLGDDEAGDEVDHHDAAVGLQPLRMSSGTLRGWRRRAGGRVGEDHRRLRHASASSIVVGETWRGRRACRAGSSRARPARRTGVRPPCLRLVGRRVGPVDGCVVRQRHVARAEAVELPQRAERVLDRVPALDADQRGDLAAP